MRRRLFLKNSTSQKIAERPSWLRGTNVRELWIHFKKDKDLGYGPDVDPILDWIPSHLPNLRALSLEQEHLSPHSNLMTTIVNIAPSLTTHALHINIMHWNKSTLLCLYDSISRMPNLSTLSIFGSFSCYKGGFTDVESLRLASISPPFSLECLMVTSWGEGKDSRPVELLTWLLQTRSQYILEDLMFRYHAGDWMSATLASHVRVFASLLAATLPCLGPQGV